MATSKFLTCSTGNLKYRQDFSTEETYLLATLDLPLQSCFSLYHSEVFRTRLRLSCVHDKRYYDRHVQKLVFGLEKEEMSKAKEMPFLEDRRNVD